jgi:3-oxoacyl-[acyl-carrier-protein] synthase III
MNESSPVGILGIGTFLPPGVRTNDYFAVAPQKERDEARRQGDVLAVDRTTRGPLAPEIVEAMARHAGDPFQGARLRRVIADGVETSDLEVEAARRALASAGLAPDAIDVLIVHSLTPDLLHPSNAPAVQHKCGLVNALAWGLDVGCASAVVALATAVGLVRGGTARKVLCVFSSAASRTIESSSSAALIFGDGAAAFVVGELPEGYGLLGAWQRTDGSLRDAVVNATMVDGKPERAWYKHAGLIRFASLDPERGRETGARQVEFCREACLGALDRAGLSIRDVDLFLGGQTLAWLPEALCRGLGLPMDRTIDTFAEVANLGSSTMPYNLEHALATGRAHDGDIVLVYAPGAGFTRAAAVFRLHAPKGAGALNALTEETHS